MYGQFVLLERGGEAETGRRIHLGLNGQKNEAWLRDTLFDHPTTIPIDEIDPTFGELIPLCKELRTGVGPVDAVFINKSGRLTIVECKLWNNPEARRKVVAQALDYVAALSSWTYADLQRQVSIATGIQGNIPFESVRRAHGQEIDEKTFVDAVSRSLREGRFLVIVAGDGIREGVRSLAELISRNTTKAFSFTLLEVAVFKFSDERLLVQPRIIADTELIERQFVTLASTEANDGLLAESDIDISNTEDTRPKTGRRHLKDWWRPILEMKFDDPEQEQPYWVTTNNAVVSLPYPGLVLKAWSKRTGDASGIFLSETRRGVKESIARSLRRHEAALLEQLPKGTVINPDVGEIGIRSDDLTHDDFRYAWLKTNLNTFVNVLRPLLKQWHAEST